MGEARNPGSKAVHVAIPQSVAFDIEAFIKVQRSILDRLGCQACCSDFDIRWGVEPDFRINDAGEIIGE
jgi:hypothetical protein